MTTSSKENCIMGFEPCDLQNGKPLYHDEEKYEYKVHFTCDVTMIEDVLDTLDGCCVDIFSIERRKVKE